MGQLDENVLERSPSLSEFAHGPAPFNGKAENLFAHIRTVFDSQRESLPIVLNVCDYVSNARDLFQFFLAVVISDLCLKLYATGLSDFPEQIVRCIARFDSPFVNDDYPAACHLHFGQDVSGKQNGVLPAQILNQLPHLPDLIRVEANGGLVENEKVGFR
jgi:hypothetical protein